MKLPVDIKVILTFVEWAERQINQYYIKSVINWVDVIDKKIL